MTCRHEEQPGDDTQSENEALAVRIIVVVGLFLLTLNGASYLAGQRSGLVEGRKQMIVEYAKMAGASHEAPRQNNQPHKEQQWK